MVINFTVISSDQNAKGFFLDKIKFLEAGKMIENKVK